MNKISTRQLYFFLAVIAPLGKLVVLPVRLSAKAENDLWIPTLALYLLQAAAVFCVLLLGKRRQDLAEILQGSIGKICSKIVLLLLALFLLFSALIPLLEQKLFVQAVFYDTLPSIVAFAPFFLFSAYLCSKPLGSSGRMFDLLGPIAIAGLVGVMVLSVGEADYAAVLPVGASGIKGILAAAAGACSWFFDPVLLLFFLGKFEYRKGTACKGALFYLLGGAVTIFFLLTFYGIFERTAVNQLFAFTKTSKYFSAITVLGRVDYVFIYALALVMTFYTALPLQCAVESCLQAFGRKKYLPTLLAVCFNTIFLVFDGLLDYRFGDVIGVYGKLFWVFLVFSLLLPPLLFLTRRTHEST